MTWLQRYRVRHYVRNSIWLLPVVLGEWTLAGKQGANAPETAKRTPPPGLRKGAAVCPGAPYGPPYTGMAKGNVAASVGLMIPLAGSSALLTPLLLTFLLPFTLGFRTTPSTSHARRWPSPNPSTKTKPRPVD